MLTNEEFEAWAERLKLPDAAKALIARIRSSAPVRRVTNTRGNMCGTFPSAKMSHTIQWESSTGELALILQWEHDPNCLEIWDQALEAKIKYTLPSGRSAGARTVIDFLLLLRDWAGAVDYKPSQNLQELALEQPYRWIQTGPHSWDQPPVRERLQELGLGYRVLSEYDLSPGLVRNIAFLQPRLERAIDVPTSTSELLKSHLANLPVLPLSEAICIVGDPQVVYSGHFQGLWYLALDEEPLALPDSCNVYRTQVAFDAHAALQRTAASTFNRAVDPGSLPIGARLVWGELACRVLNRTDASVYLLVPGQPVLELAQTEFRRLIEKGEITILSEVGTNNPSLEVLRAASERSIESAIRKLKLLESIDAGMSLAEAGVPSRTYYAWRAQYRGGEALFGSGFVGLVPRNDKKGNRQARTEPREQEILELAFKWLRDKVPREPHAGYAYYVSLCNREAVQERSFGSFMDRWNATDRYEKTKDREGIRAAYPEKAARATGGPHLRQGPPEGDSPFAVVHIDHLSADVFCRRFNSAELLGKPWITLAIDAFTRLVLGFWLSMLAPSHAGVMMALRDMIRRHGRLPLMTITDGGSEFRSERVQKYLARYGCGHGFRPKSEPRYGNPVERLNLNINHHLTKVVHGSNEVLKTPRMSTSTHDPRNLALQTVPSLASALEKMLFVTYPKGWHSGVQDTPSRRLQDAAITQGNAWGKPVAFDEHALYQTLVLARKHGGLMRQRDGIRLNTHNYYCSEMVGTDHKKLTDLPLYDPEDPSYIYARLAGRMHRCELIDSQRRRLPPGNLRYYLDERIFLARSANHSDANRDFLVAMGEHYQELASESPSPSEEHVPRERESDVTTHAKDSEPTNRDATAAGTADASENVSSRDRHLAPISRRKRTGD